MYVTHLGRVRGSVMLAVPPALLDLLDMGAGAAVGLAVEDGRLIVSGRPRARHALAELPARCDPRAESSGEDRDWTSAGPAGDELP